MSPSPTPPAAEARPGAALSSPAASRLLPHLVLPVLVVAQFLGLALWFSGSAVVSALMRDWGLAPGEEGLLLSAVNAGFIVGTVLLAATNLADRFAASRVFLGATLFGAATNLLFATAGGLGLGLTYRFLTGVALAGIYPVGMKLVVSWFPDKAGQALGWLLGALTLGSASPFLLAGVGAELPWRALLGATSAMAVAAGVIVAALGDGPHLPPARKLDVRMLGRVFAIPGYRGAALGYFGHMWELYAVWGLSPLLVRAALEPLGAARPAWVSLGAFAVIGLGAVGCVAGGWLSRRWGSLVVAAVALAVSGAMCVVSPWLLAWSPWLYLAALAVWGVSVVADSPQFSALSSRTCPPDYVATALTVQNGIGFALTIVTVEWASRWFEAMGPHVSWLLAPGPVLGLLLLLHPRNRPPRFV